VKTFRTSFALTLAALCYCAVSPARAAQHVSKQQWRRVKVYEMPDLQKLDPPPLGKIVGVKFNYRHTDISQPHAYWYLGSIWRVIRDPEKADFMHVNVMVAEADLPAFKAITTDPHSQRSYVVYGEVLYYRESTFSFIRLIGTKGKRDRSGNVTVSW
jgi:hypothetical protein